MALSYSGQDTAKETVSKLGSVLLRADTDKGTVYKLGSDVHSNYCENNTYLQNIVVRKHLANDTAAPLGCNY